MLASSPEWAGRQPRRRPVTAGSNRTSGVGRIVHFEITADDIDRAQRSSGLGPIHPRRIAPASTPGPSRLLANRLTRLLCLLSPPHP
jgi:hypothetical protein